MITDSDGNQYVVTQNLLDTIELARSSFLEDLASLGGQGSVEEALALTITKMTHFQSVQMMACVDAVGKLESRFLGLMRHHGISDLEIADFDARLSPSDPEGEVK